MLMSVQQPFLSQAERRRRPHQKRKTSSRKVSAASPVPAPSRMKADVKLRMPSVEEETPPVMPLLLALFFCFM